MSAKALNAAIKSHRDKLTQAHFLLSADNPKFPEKNILGLDHDTVLSHLKGAGYDAHTVAGHYSKPERSILIYGVDSQQAEKLHGVAANLGQDSSVSSDGTNHEMRFHHGEHAGKKLLGQGTNWHQNKPEGYHTTLPGGTHHFSHNFSTANEKESA